MIAPILIWSLSLAGDAPSRQPEPAIRVGSKLFVESAILGELAVHLLRSAGARATHRPYLGGTRFLWEALRGGELDLYPEYTGTLREEIFAGRALDDDAALAGALAELGLAISRPLGFSNNYVIGMRQEVADRLGIRLISNLASHPELRLGLSSEFMSRGDGWPALRHRYGLPQRNVRGLDHELAYRGLLDGTVDVTDLYSTDPELDRDPLVGLEDDRAHFPRYDAVWLYRRDLIERVPQALNVLGRVEGRITEAQMRRMNARVKFDRVPEAQVAADFLGETFGLSVGVEKASLASQLLQRTGEHLLLVGISLAAAIAAGVPLGILSARKPRLGQLVLGTVGIVQTIPSLALLVFMIPLLGIGVVPAILALFLYGLLPIVRSTYTGLREIAPGILESAQALGLPARARLWRIELPIASRSILSGIKTAAVIDVGTATLGAFIGAGGYGQPIFTGILLRSNGLILQGAIPAALLALAVHGLFELLERTLVPRGLRLGTDA